MADSVIAMRSRRTVVDGEVRMFAESFVEIKIPTGKRYEANGPFYISASRNQVTVHFCELQTVDACQKFLAAMQLAIGALDELKRSR